MKIMKKITNKPTLYILSIALFFASCAKEDIQYEIVEVEVPVVQTVVETVEVEVKVPVVQTVEVPTLTNLLELENQQYPLVDKLQG